MKDLQKMSSKMRVLILLIALFGLGIFVYGDTLSSLFFSLLRREDSSHGLIVPLISGYLIWRKLEKIKGLKPDFDPVPAIMMVGAGLLLFSLVASSTEVALPALSFLLVAVGLVAGLFGRDVFKELSFPLFFLVTMIPLPKPLYAQISEWMRGATTWGSVWLVQLFDFTIYREGYTIYLPNIILFVNHSCSGIRHLIPYFVFGLAYAFVCKKTMKSRVLVVLASIPMSIISSVLRQSFIYLSAYYIGPFMAGHRPHILISWSVFVVVLAGAIWMDRKISKAQSA